MCVFVTGIPGAGKTLCGLNVVFGADTGAAFLTGNLPLVHVMREALARDARDQGAQHPHGAPADRKRDPAADRLPARQPGAHRAAA